MTTTEKGTRLLIWMIVFTVLVVLSLVGRFWALALQKRAWRPDDYLVIFAFICLLGIEIPVFVAYNHNLGADAWDLTYDEAKLLLEIQLTTGVTWTLATCACKAAVLWMYLTIFSLTKLVRVIYVLVAVCAAYAIAFIPIFLTACDPPEAAWSSDPAYTKAHCRPIQVEEYASVISCMILDLIIVVLPMPVIWKLRMPLGRKIFVTLMFSLGLLIVGVMSWRIKTTHDSYYTTNWSSTLMTVAIQSFLEIWLGILAANLPVMSPLLTRLLIPAVVGFLSSITSRGQLLPVSGSSKPTFGGWKGTNSREMSANKNRWLGRDWTRDDSTQDLTTYSVDVRHNSDVESGAASQLLKFPANAVQLDVTISSNVSEVSADKANRRST